MAGVSVRVVGKAGLRAKLRRFARDTPNEISKAIAISAIQIQGEAQRGIQRGTRSGLLYRRRSIIHRASAPGEFPKTDTGRLVSSIFAELDSDGLGGAVGSDIEYAGYLEFGTTKMAARPWLQPTFDKMKIKVRDRIVEAMRRAAQRQTR